MREFKKQRSRPVSLAVFALQVVGVGVLCVVTVGAMRAAAGMYGKLTTATAGQSEAETELATLEAQRVRVAASVAELSSQRGTEAQIRQRYGVVKPGEGEIEIVRDSAAAAQPLPAKESWWRGIFRALFVW